MPTPGIAYLTRALRLEAGIVISASHNPYDDNGIKFFSAAGTKLPDDIEAAIEARMEAPLDCVASAQLGKARRIDDAAGRYIEFCKGTFPSELDLRGLRIVVDCAHGAGYHVAPPVFHELGADVIAVGAAPDGININAGVGATHPAFLVEQVRTHGADLGIAVDGDGDRLMMVDRDGVLYDGDQLLYVIATDYRRRGVALGGVVGTLMSNLGFEQALARRNIAFARARVGDRHVLEQMRERGWLLGGENSGHVICLDKHSTGDGIIAALAVLRALIEQRMTLAEATADLTMFPQRLINVPVTREWDWQACDPVVVAERAAVASLGRRRPRPAAALRDRARAACDGRGARPRPGRPPRRVTGGGDRLRRVRVARSAGVSTGCCWRFLRVARSAAPDPPRAWHRARAGPSGTARRES